MTRIPFSGLDGQAAAGTIGVGVPDAFQRVQADPATFGGAAGAAAEKLGRSLEQAGGVGLEIAARQQAFENHGAVAEALNQAEGTTGAVLHGDENDPSNTGYLNSRGKDAMGKLKGTVETVQGAYENARNGLQNDAQRAMFDQQSRSRLNSTIGQLQQHGSAQAVAYAKDQQSASVELAMRSADNAASDEALWQQGRDEVLARQQKTNAMLGLSPEASALALAKTESALLTRRVQRFDALGDPITAKAYLEANVEKIDPDMATRLLEHLTPRVERQQEDDKVGRLSGMGNGPRGQVPASSIAAAIHQQESGGNATSATSIDGARGGWQIIPATFAGYAKPGERIDNPADNERVGRRIVDDLSQRFNGDPARVAVGYFSGPGNVAPAGSPTPWLQDKKDGNGKSVSGYVRDVLGRMGRSAEAPNTASGDPVARALGVDTSASPTSTRSAAPGLYVDGRLRTEDEVVALADADTPGMSLEARMRVRTRLLSLRSEEARRQAGDVAQFHQTFADTVAAKADGRDVPSVPENRIRAVAKTPEQATEMIEQQRFADTTGQMRTAMMFASPGERAQILQAAAADTGNAGRATIGPAKDGVVAPTPGAGDTVDGYRRRQQRLAAAQQAMSDIDKRLAADPASYVAAMPTLQPLLVKAAAPNATPDDRAAAVQATMAAQAYMGVPEDKRRALPVNQVEGLVHRLKTVDPSKGDMGMALDTMAKGYGSAWPDVYGSMVRHGLPAEYQALGVMTPDAGKPDLWINDRADFQRGLTMVSGPKGREELETAAGKAVAKEIKEGLDGKLVGFKASTINNIGGADLYNRVRSATETHALVLAYQGESSASALEKAYQAQLGKKYDFDGTMRVPKGSLDDVRTAIRNEMSRLTVDDMPVLPSSTSGLSDRQKQEQLYSVIRSRPMWVNMPDDGGLILMGRGRNNQPITFNRADGSPVTIRFDHLQQFGPEAPGAEVAKREMRGAGGSALPRARNRPADDPDDRGPIARLWRGW